MTDRNSYGVLQSKVYGFSDEARPFGGDIFGVEAIAEVDASCELLDDFGQTEVKWGLVKSQFLNVAYNRKSAWLDQFKRTKVFIVDPLKLTGSQHFTEMQLSELLVALDPAGWQFCLPLQMNSVTYSLEDYNSWHKFRHVAVFDASNKKGTSAINSRRRLLRSQAQFSEIMPYMPFGIESGEMYRREHQDTPEATEFLLPLKAKLTLDKGHSSDIPILWGHRGSLQERTAVLKHFESIPETGNGYVIEMPSHKHELIQLADFCAGYACDLYVNDLTRATLPQLFQKVYVNGILMD